MAPNSSPPHTSSRTSPQTSPNTILYLLTTSPKTTFNASPRFSRSLLASHNSPTSLTNVFSVLFFGWAFSLLQSTSPHPITSPHSASAASVTQSGSSPQVMAVWDSQCEMLLTQNLGESPHSSDRERRLSHLSEITNLTAETLARVRKYRGDSMVSRVIEGVKQKWLRKGVDKTNSEGMVVQGLAISPESATSSEQYDDITTSLISMLTDITSHTRADRVKRWPVGQTPRRLDGSTHSPHLSHTSESSTGTNESPSPHSSRHGVITEDLRDYLLTLLDVVMVVAMDERLNEVMTFNADLMNEVIKGDRFYGGRRRRRLNEEEIRGTEKAEISFLRATDGIATSSRFLRHVQVDLFSLPLPWVRVRQNTNASFWSEESDLSDVSDKNKVGESENHNKGEGGEDFHPLSEEQIASLTHLTQHIITEVGEAHLVPCVRKIERDEKMYFPRGGYGDDDEPSPSHSPSSPKRQLNPSDSPHSSPLQHLTPSSQPHSDVVGCDRCYTPNDLNQSQWHLNDVNKGSINSQQTWFKYSGFTTSPDHVIAVVDSGAIYHSDFEENIWINPNEICGDGIDNDMNGYIDDCYGYHFSAGVGNPLAAIDDANTQYKYRHGTAVFGCAAARGNNGVGSVGSCPFCKVMVLNVVNQDATLSVAAIVEAINYLIMMGVKVSNHSYGANGVRHSLRNAFEAMEAHGVVAVVAAGNDGCNMDESVCHAFGTEVDLGKMPFVPPSYSDLSNVITVGSVSQTIDKDVAASVFSNTGVRDVHLFAPGSSITGVTS
eukprot:GHVN01096833.1.p1 GENE.GHVN01096833.1~~GHVN01096833.1.p1  ORF type:complete len:775 (+),score=224.84 GHVN01096833.1:1481-3805(+)